jgi:hypothetical protein
VNALVSIAGAGGARLQRLRLRLVSSTSTRKSSRYAHTPRRRLWVLGALILRDCSVVVRRIKLRPVSAPSGLFNRDVDLSQAFCRNSQGDHLSDPHHHIPRDHFDPRRRKIPIVTLLPKSLVDIIQRFRLIVPKKDREQDRSLFRFRSGRRVHKKTKLRLTARWFTLTLTIDPAGSMTTAAKRIVILQTLTP